MTGDNASSLKSHLDQLATEGVRIAHVGIYDLMGTFRERRLGIKDALTVLDNGGTFVNVLPQWDASESVFGSGPFVGEPVTIDPDSVRPYPFEANACMMVADYAGDSSVLSAKTLLRSQIDKASAMGFDVHAAFESEFIVLEENATTLRDSGFARLNTYAKDNRCWAGESAAVHAEFVHELEHTLVCGGLNLHALSLELGPGCFEVTLRHTAPMRAAEDHLALKMFVKAFCRQRGLTASFMAQLGADFPGLSQHPHVSLTDKNSGDNAFATPEPGVMSPTFKQFVAGMTHLIPQAMALTHCNPNAYRRLAPGNWAPKSASWAIQNYSAAVRVVIAPNAQSRLEYRLPGADANPYLNLAFILGAGLWGIEHDAMLPDEFVGGGPDELPTDDAALPHDLLTALAALEHSQDAQSIWNPAFLTHFINAMKVEEAALRREVSTAERTRYLEIV